MMTTKLETVHGVVDKPPVGLLDFIFYCSEYEGWYRVHLTPEHLMMYSKLLVRDTRLRLVVNVDREKGEMYLYSAQLDTTRQAVKKV